MDAKEYLNEIQKYNIRIECKLAEIDQLRNLALKTSATISAAPARGGEPDKLGALVSAIADKEAELKRIVEAYITERDKRIALIEQLDDPTEYTVLHMRYVCGKKFDDIAAKESYTYRWVLRKHKTALKKIQNILNSSL